MTDEQTPADFEADAPEATAEETYEKMQAERDEWRDKALRAVAETENTRRRAERETNDARAYAIQRFAKDLFQAADNLERASLVSRSARRRVFSASAAARIALSRHSASSAASSSGVRSSVSGMSSAS